MVAAFADHQADRMALPLSAAYCADRLDGPWKQLAAAEGNVSYITACKMVEQAVRSLAKQYPSDPDLIARLAILAPASGSDPETVFAEYEK